MNVSVGKCGSQRATAPDAPDALRKYVKCGYLSVMIRGEEGIPASTSLEEKCLKREGAVDSDRSRKHHRGKRNCTFFVRAFSQDLFCGARLAFVLD